MKTCFESVTPELIAQRQKMHELCRVFSRSPSKGNLKRLKHVFSSCGEQVIIEAGFYCDYGDRISVGNRVYINANCTFLDGGLITIGDDCMFGPNVQLLSVGHDTKPLQRLEKLSYIDDITLGNNVWLGGGVIVLAGVSIGEGSVIAAGSVVTKDVESQSLYAGNPAVKIKSL